MMRDREIKNPNHFTFYSHVFVIPLDIEKLLSQERQYSEFCCLKENYQRIIQRVQEYERALDSTFNPGAKAQRILKNLIQASLYAA